MELHAEREFTEVPSKDGIHKAFEPGPARYTIDGKEVTEAEFGRAFLAKA